MSKEKYQQLSKFLCYVLRHEPDEIHLIMDHEGFVNVEQLINNVNEYTSYNLDEDILKEIVDTDSKGRYEYTGGEIRCVQGHSIPWVDPKPTIKEPPTYLYHGTTMEAFESIKKDGEIKKMKRHAVHMQVDVSKATQSAKRWHSSDPVVLVIDAHAMYVDGYEFGVTKNNVWLTDHVPIKYISRYIVMEEFKSIAKDDEIKKMKKWKVIKNE